MDKEDAASVSEDEEQEEEPPRKPTPGPMPEYQYSRDELMEIAETDPARERPDCLHKSFDTPSDLDRDVLSRNRKTSSSDPKERLKEERDGIVLSPQRRSFGTGCHVSQTTSSLITGASSSVYRQSSLTDYKDRDDRDRDRTDRDRDRDRSERDRMDRDRDRMDRDRDRDRIDRDRIDRDRRFEDRSDRFRRSDSRDFGDKMAERGRRRYNNHEDETPEWFTGGPTSQNDTIELRGFERDRERDTHLEEEEYEEEEEKPAGEGRKRRIAVNESGVSVGERNGSLETNESSSPEAPPEERETRPSPQPSPNTASLFDFNQFFNIEHIPGLVDPQVDPEAFGENAGEACAGGSRFSKWFQSQQSAAAAASAMSHQQDRSNSNSTLGHNHRNSPVNIGEDFHYLNDMVEGSRSPRGQSPPPPTAAQLFGERNYYAPFPINQDGLTAGPDNHMQQKNLPPRVSALFQNSAAEKSATPSSRGSLSNQDVEAQLKALLFGGARDSASSSGTASPANVPPGVQRKMKTVAELEADMHQNSPGRGQSPASTSTSSASGSAGPPPPRNDDGDQSAFNRLLSLMKVPIIQHPPQAQQQVVAPRPVLPQGMGQVPRASQDPIRNFLQQNPTIVMKPPIAGPVLQRVPSPQELVAHTQAILQNALIKRKLEDQKERYLKKQQERDKSPSQQAVSAATKTATSTPSSPATTQAKPANMAFTPTSVIRKMHSDRVSEKEKQSKESDEDSGDNQLSTKLHFHKQGSDSFDDSAVGSGDTGITEASDLNTRAPSTPTCQP
nr:hypothetical protein BaRGS_030915 [Batillaria attramentaria]